MDAKMQAEIDTYLEKMWDSMTREGTKAYLDGASHHVNTNLGWEKDFWADTQAIATVYVTVAHERWAEEPSLSTERRQEILDQARKEALDMLDEMRYSADAE